MSSSASSASEWSEEGSSAAEVFTEVDKGRFVLPVKRLGVSGGTAPFFSLRLRRPEHGQSADHWIGKDLSHARDEISFYEERRVLDSSEAGGLEDLFGFMFEYEGVLECTEEGGSGDQLQLLVLRNLQAGCRHFRMADIKMGERTAQAGWQGKSYLHAIRQSLMDACTNSQAEGFRLEGFNGKPPALESLNPLLDVESHGLLSTGWRQHFSQAKARKRADRIAMQRMHASEVLMHLFDLHQLPSDPGPTADSVLTPTEFADSLMKETARRLAGLASACGRCSVPQKWIGSSVALGFDDARLPRRGTPQEEVVRSLRVSIFDWGRSELNTPERHAALSMSGRADRQRFWADYTRGVERLAWEAARGYWHRFCNTAGWTSAFLAVYDFDSATANDYIGGVEVPLAPTGETTLQLMDHGGQAVDNAGKQSTITFSVAWRELPAGSPLIGAWRVHVKRANNLTGLDHSKGLNTSDPFVSVVAVGKNRAHTFRQDTKVITETLDPCWDETFEIPVASKRPDFLVTLLDLCDSGDIDAAASKMFPAVTDSVSADTTNSARSESWLQCCKQDSSTKAFDVWKDCLAASHGLSK